MEEESNKLADDPQKKQTQPQTPRGNDGSHDAESVDKEKEEQDSAQKEQPVIKQKYLAEKSHLPIEIYTENKKLASYDLFAQDGKGAVVFHKHHSVEDIPDLLHIVFNLSEFSPRIKSTSFIEIPLTIDGNTGVLIVKIKSEKRIKEATFVHHDERLPQWQANWKYKRSIEKSLREIHESAVCSVKSLPAPKSSSSDLATSNAELQFEREAGYNRWGVLDDESQNERHTAAPPRRPSSRAQSFKESSVPEENQYIYPKPLYTFKLPELTLEKLQELHRQYKQLKLQRLHNLGRGNAYREMEPVKAFAAPSALFLNSLADYLSTHKPLFYSVPFVERIAKALNTKTYQAYHRICEFYEALNTGHITKKLTQCKSPKRKDLVIKDTLRWGAGNIDQDLSKKEFDLAYGDYCNQMIRPVISHLKGEEKKEMAKRIETIIHNRAHLHARTR